MIALSDGIPLVSTPDSPSSSFNKDWIADSLKVAAYAAGYEQWFIAQEIVESVMLYLQHEWEGTTISTLQLEYIVKDLLFALDHKDIALQWSLPAPPLQLSLLDLVKEAGDGYELLFFQLLRKKLHVIATSTIRELHLFDLTECVDALKCCLRFQRKEILKKEIIHWVRHYTHWEKKRDSSKESGSREHPLKITIS